MIIGIYGYIYGYVEPFRDFKISGEILKIIAELDEFKGRWQALGQLAPDRLKTLRRIATVESVGSSTRIEGAKLTNSEVKRLLTGIQISSLSSATSRKSRATQKSWSKYSAHGL